MAKLEGKLRDKVGSRWSRRLRLQGRIPANIQGEGQDNLNFSIDETEFLTARRHHEHLFDIEYGSGKEDTALVRELQWGPFGERILHVEFRRVIRGQETEAEVELEFVGHPKGGVLNHLITHVPVLALPSNIPDNIEVRVDQLEVGHPMTVADLVLPEGVRVNLPEETQIALASEVRAEVVATEEESEEGAEAPAPEAPTEE